MVPTSIPFATPQTQAAQFDPSRLVDIQLPEAITLWPVAPGWWLLLVMIIIFLSLLIYLIKRKPTIPLPTSKELKSQALKELHVIRDNYDPQSNPHKTVKTLSIFLRRYALSLYQRDSVASLTDEEWLSLLDNIINKNSKQDPNNQSGQFSDKYSNLLTQVPYQSDKTVIDTELLTELLISSEQLIKKSFKHFTVNKTPLQEKTDV